MIECIFTLDYEVYGSGEGALRELVFEPAQKLKAIFDRAGARLVVFVEAAELEAIEGAGADIAIDEVKQQILDFHRTGYEVGLHLHPQWCRAQYCGGRWALNYSEYNLCVLPKERIAEIVGGAVRYLGGVVGRPDFAPLSFRAGNWLFQPTETAAAVLAEQGIRVDSSVFKGGVQRQHKLDYRRALRNGPYWTFRADAATEDPAGELLEIPIYTRLAPFWKLLTAKRVGLQHKAAAARRTFGQKLERLRDYGRFRLPLKFDFCRLNLSELIELTQAALEEDRRTPELFKPMVAIGHTKDLTDADTVERYLAWLAEHQIPICTFEEAYPKCRAAMTSKAVARSVVAKRE